MALKDALEEERKTHKGPRCSLCALIPTLDPNDARVLEEYLGNPVIQGTQIARALTREGHEIGAHVVVRHRRGDCLPR
jgi:hypothetical protein